MNGRSVLVVDDDAELLEAVARVLRGAGFEVRTARNGRAVKELILGRAPDLVITDILMPDRDGVEVIEELRRTTRGIRVLAMSGRSDFGGLNLLDLAKSLGADATLAKPFNGDDLLAKVNALIPPARSQVR
jgi:DNA-binding response OmpR family regulator